MIQHLLSETYLKGFADPTVPEGKTPYAWAFTTQVPTWQRRFLGTLAAESDYYTVPELGDQEMVIEDYLNKVETGFSLVMEHCITGRKPLTEEDRARLAEFMTTSLLRTRAQHERMLERLQGPARERLRAQLDHLRANPDEFAKLKHEYETKKGAPMGFGLEDIDPEKLILDVDHRAMMGTMLEAVPYIAHTLRQMTWVIYRTSPSAPFVTSDWPGALLFPRDAIPSHGSWREGLKLPAATFSFNLSRDYALLGVWANKPFAYATTNASDVRIMNLRACTYARHMVIAPGVSFPGARLIVKRMAMPNEDRPG